MPRLDKTGPQGAGPKTGRGMGYCYPNSGRGYLRRGWGRGFGMGMCPMWGFPESFYDRMSPKEEKESLNEESKYLKEEIKEIEKRLAEIGKEK